MTDENGGLVQTLDYYPYGATRVSVATSTNEKRKFIGQFRDNSGLDYLNARYYSSDRGQFISQDPVFWEIGQTNDGKGALLHPQALNSYAYANDNPITGKDPSGRTVWEYQPYLSVGSNYVREETLGSYRGQDIRSRGPNVPSLESPYQCVDFARDFAQNQFGLSIGGIGADYANQANMNKVMQANPKNTGLMTVYPNGSGVMPRENDFISWSLSGERHVGVIAQVQLDAKSGSGMVYTVEQNYGYQRGLFSQPLTRNSDGTYKVGNGGRSDLTVTGWSRYGNQSTAPSYTPYNQTLAPKPAIKNKSKP